MQSVIAIDETRTRIVRAPLHAAPFLLWRIGGDKIRMWIVANVGRVVGGVSNESFIQNILVTMNSFNFGLLLISKEDWSTQVRGEVTGNENHFGNNNISALN